MIPRNLCNRIFPIPSNLKFEDWWVAYKLVLENKVLIINDYVTFYRIGDNNEIGFNTKNLFSLVGKDYARHIEYIEEFKRISDNIFLISDQDSSNNLQNIIGLIYSGRYLVSLFV